MYPIPCPTPHALPLLSTFPSVSAYTNNQQNRASHHQFTQFALANGPSTVSVHQIEYLSEFCQFFGRQTLRHTQSSNTFLTLPPTPKSVSKCDIMVSLSMLLLNNVVNNGSKVGVKAASEGAGGVPTTTHVRPCICRQNSPFLRTH